MHQQWQKRCFVSIQNVDLVDLVDDSSCAFMDFPFPSDYEFKRKHTGADQSEKTGRLRAGLPLPETQKKTWICQTFHENNSECFSEYKCKLFLEFLRATNLNI